MNIDYYYNETAVVTLYFTDIRTRRLCAVGMASWLPHSSVLHSLHTVHNKIWIILRYFHMSTGNCISAYWLNTHLRGYFPYFSWHGFSALECFDSDWILRQWILQTFVELLGGRNGSSQGLYLPTYLLN